MKPDVRQTFGIAQNLNEHDKRGSRPAVAHNNTGHVQTYTHTLLHQHYDKCGIVFVRWLLADANTHFASENLDGVDRLLLLQSVKQIETYERLVHGSHLGSAGGNANGAVPVYFS